MDTQAMRKTENDFIFAKVLGEVCKTMIVIVLKNFLITLDFSNLGKFLDGIFS